ncbi:MAG TPA: aldolase [Methanocorpusculum sp.]|nr:aldolase [Methanocorpusculum sp.]
MTELKIPLDVPDSMRDNYINNYNLITAGSGRLMLFAGDQKIEHLNDDFVGDDISSDDADPEHLFRIASKSKIGVFATQLGLITRYAMDYKNIPYLVKMNSKTNLVSTTQKDPVSTKLWFVDQIEKLISQGIKITGIGYTIYLGSEYENIMMAEAAQLINAAHQYGMVTVLWIYPRGKSVINEKDPHLIAGAAGVAACLGSDFVKVNPPKAKEGSTSAELLKEAVKAAGRTKLVCAGGSSTDPKKFLSDLYDQIHIGGASGNATGRNIHQKSLVDAIKFCNAIYAITVENKTVDEAIKNII